MVSSPCCHRGSGEYSQAPQFKGINSSALSLLYDPNLTSIHDYWKTLALTMQTFVGKVMSLLFNMLSRSVIAFLSRSKHLLISWMQSLSTWFWSPGKKSVTVSPFFPSIFHKVMGPDAMILVFWMLSFKPALNFSNNVWFWAYFQSSVCFL